MPNELTITQARDLFDNCANTYLSKIHEELSELQVAIHHFRDQKVGVNDVLSEVADATIQIRKLMFYLSEFNDDKEIGVRFMFEKALDRKNKDLQRIIDRI